MIPIKDEDKKSTLAEIGIRQGTKVMSQASIEKMQSSSNRGGTYVAPRPETEEEREVRLKKAKKEAKMREKANMFTADSTDHTRFDDDLGQIPSSTEDRLEECRNIFNGQQSAGADQDAELARALANSMDDFVMDAGELAQ